MLRCQDSVPHLPPCLSHLRGIVGHGLHHGGLAWELLWVVGDVGRVRGGGHQRWTGSGGGSLHHGRGGGWLVLVRALGGAGSLRVGGRRCRAQAPSASRQRTAPRGAPPDPAHLWRPGTCPAVQALSWTQDKDTSAVPGDQNTGEAEQPARKRPRQVGLGPPVSSVIPLTLGPPDSSLT